MANLVIIRRTNQHVDQSRVQEWQAYFATPCHRHPVLIVTQGRDRVVSDIEQLPLGKCAGPQIERQRLPPRQPLPCQRARRVPRRRAADRAQNADITFGVAQLKLPEDRPVANESAEHAQRLGPATPAQE